MVISFARIFFASAFARFSLTYLLSSSTAIPALQPIVHDLFVLRGSNKADAGKELDTQKEVVVSMLLRLVQYHQVWLQVDAVVTQCRLIISLTSPFSWHIFLKCVNRCWRCSSLYCSSVTKRVKTSGRGYQGRSQMSYCPWLQSNRLGMFH